MEETHHHHHHHHSSSGSSSSHHRHSSGNFCVPPRANYSQVIVITALLLVIILSPLYFVLLSKNRKLQERINELERNLDVALSNGEVNSASSRHIDTSTPSATENSPSNFYYRPSPRKPIDAGNSRRITQDTEQEDAVVAAREEEKPQEPTVRRRKIRERKTFASENEISTSTGMPIHKIQALKEIMLLSPNGMRAIPDGKGYYVFERDPIADNLENAYELLKQGKKHDALIIFETIAEAIPEWPYVYLFMGIARGETADISYATTLFSIARAVDASTAEANVYDACASLFKKSFSDANAMLARIPYFTDMPTEVGPVFVPSGLSNDMKIMLSRTPGFSDIIEINWK